MTCCPLVGLSWTSRMWYFWWFYGKLNFVMLNSRSLCFPIWKFLISYSTPINSCSFIEPKAKCGQTNYFERIIYIDTNCENLYYPSPMARNYFYHKFYYFRSLGRLPRGTCAWRISELRNVKRPRSVAVEASLRSWGSIIQMNHRNFLQIRSIDKETLNEYSTKESCWRSGLFMKPPF